MWKKFPWCYFISFVKFSNHAWKSCLCKVPSLRWCSTSPGRALLQKLKWPRHGWFELSAETILTISSLISQTLAGFSPQNHRFLRLLQTSKQDHMQKFLNHRLQNPPKTPRYQIISEKTKAAAAAAAPKDPRFRPLWMAPKSPSSPPLLKHGKLFLRLFITRSLC